METRLRGLFAKSPLKNPPKTFEKQIEYPQGYQYGQEKFNILKV